MKFVMFTSFGAQLLSSGLIDIYNMSKVLNCGRVVMFDIAENHSQIWLMPDVTSIAIVDRAVYRSVQKGKPNWILNSYNNAIKLNRSLWTEVVWKFSALVMLFRTGTTFTENQTVLFQTELYQITIIEW